jgi:hypothetical protein
MEPVYLWIGENQYRLCCYLEREREKEKGKNSICSQDTTRPNKKSLCIPKTQHSEGQQGEDEGWRGISS